MARKGLTECCEECSPHLCNCPMSPEQVIEARLICLASSIWDEDEKRGFREELLGYLENENFTSLVQAALDSEDLGPKKKKRLLGQLRILGGTKMKCMICGKIEGQKDEHGQTIYLNKTKLPHGHISICQHSRCTSLFSIMLHDAIPIVWVSDSDLWEDNDNDNYNKITDEEHDNLTAEDLIEIANNTQEIFCDDSYNEAYNQAIEGAVNLWREGNERKLVEDSPIKELPLLIGALKFQRNTEILERRLKNE